MEFIIASPAHGNNPREAYAFDLTYLEDSEDAVVLFNGTEVCSADRGFGFAWTPRSFVVAVAVAFLVAVGRAAVDEIVSVSTIHLELRRVVRHDKMESEAFCMLARRVLFLPKFGSEVYVPEVCSRVVRSEAKS